MGYRSTRGRVPENDSDETETELNPPSPSNDRKSTNHSAAEDDTRVSGTARKARAGTSIHRSVVAERIRSQREVGGPDRGSIEYDLGPDRKVLSDRYGIDFVKSGQGQKIQRLETEFGSDRVRRWVDEGMTVETMAKPREMETFRERQAERPDEVPKDIERHNEASLQRNAARNRDDGPAGDTRAPDVVRDVVASPGRSLDETVQREMEAKLGDDFEDVRIHTGPRAAEAANAIDARAFTVGSHIAFNSGEYDPDSPEGQRVLAHELTHVRQQTDGAVSMLPKVADLVIDPDPKLEQAAKKVAQAVTDDQRKVTGIGSEIHVQRSPAPGPRHPDRNRAAPVTVQRDTRTDGTEGTDSVGPEEEMTEQAKVKAQELLDQGLHHFGAGEYRKAIIFFERARNVSGTPKGAEADLLYNIGECNLQLRRFATAITYFEQYLEMKPDAEGDKEVREKLAEAKRGAGISTDSTETEMEGPDVEMSEEANEKSWKLFEQASRHYFAGEYRKAIILFERARNVSGISAEVEANLLYQIGKCNLELRRFATAITYFEQYLEIKPDSEVVKKKLAEAKRGAGVPTDGTEAEFEPGTTVVTTSALRIRDGPGTDYASQATAPEGVTGTVVEGPQEADSYTWWKIEYDAGYTGWSAQPWLQLPI